MNDLFEDTPVARARNVKPALFKNEILGAADAINSLFFVGLWTLADRRGILEDRPLRIKAELFPYRDVDAESLLKWLHENGFIRRYEAKNRKCILILAFCTHQNPHANETPNDLPAPEESRKNRASSSKGRRTISIGGAAPADSLSLDSLNPQPSSLIPEPPLPEPDQTWARFDLFWSAYPKKVDKEKAKTAWKKLATTKELLDIILADLARRRMTIEWTKEGGQFVPNPGTYINGRRWQDEITNGANNGHQQRDSGLRFRGEVTPLPADEAS